MREGQCRGILFSVRLPDQSLYIFKIKTIKIGFCCVWRFCEELRGKGGFRLVGGIRTNTPWPEMTK